jgi:hypothetical protein
VEGDAAFRPKVRHWPHSQTDVRVASRAVVIAGEVREKGWQGDRETRLGVATLTLARYRSNFVFGKGRKGPQGDYLLPISTGIHADRAGIHADHTAVHAGHKSAESWGKGGRRAYGGHQEYAIRPTSAGGTIAPSPCTFH